MMCPKVSIVMPVYNAGHYLHRAIGSILSQTMKEWELILVDDGSTDGSSAVCDEYASKDTRIRVVHKLNGGVASARQMGTNLWRGEYSIHCDADDWIEPDMLATMYAAAKDENADMVISDFYYEDADGNLSKQAMEHVSNSGTLLKEILRGHVHGSLCNKMLRHSLYVQYSVSYIENVNYCEDVLILAQFLDHGIRITHVSTAFYHYCLENENSITRDYSSSTFQMRKKYIEALKNLRQEEDYKHSIDVATLLVKTEAISRGYLKWPKINICEDYLKTSLLAPFDRVYGNRLRIRYIFWYCFNLLRPF